MRVPSSILVLACAALVAVATGAAKPVPLVGCDAIVTPTGSFEWKPKRVVLGVAAVPPAYIPETVASGSGRWRYSSKAGLAIRAGTAVIVSVPPRWRERVAIGWGDAGPARALRLAPCPATGPLGDWNPYAGAFALRDRAACVPLTFRSRGRTATVRFGVGKRC